MKPLVLTSGEPAGIGPDLCIQWAQRHRDYDAVVLADRDTLLTRAQQLNLPLRIHEYANNHAPQRCAAEITLLHCAQAVATQPGQLDVRNAQHVLNMLDLAIAGCSAHEFSAMVTLPISKAVVNSTGIAFTGHTEYLAAATHTPHVVMMLVGGGIRVALATTHLPLRAVAAAITYDDLTRTITILHTALRAQFGIAEPNILVSGLNPHAGESGNLGDEEIRIIEPVIAQLRTQGMRLTGPLPADTLFQPKYLQHADAVLTMYHDQGLPVLKHASFGMGVNITLGLPIIRTSVDHGTALDLAGTGRAQPGSLFAAIDLAIQLANLHG